MAGPPSDTRYLLETRLLEWFFKHVPETVNGEQMENLGLKNADTGQCGRMAGKVA